MKWTLVVPGALVPAALAPQLASAVRAPQLVQWLARARPGPETSTGEHNAGAPHWSWLARAFGLDDDPPVTAPYAWQASGEPDPRSQACWIALCDPVHMAIARDHLVVTDFGDDPLEADEAQSLFTLANEVVCDAASPAAATAGGGATAGLRFARRGGQWFLLSDQGLQIETHALDAVLGQSVHERMPTGPDARRWRILANEIQMLWHASSVNQAREDRNARPANALWIHGAGRWRALRPGNVTQLRVEPDSTDDAVLRGWMHAAAQHAGSALPREAALAAGDTVSLCREVFAAFAHQAWDSWLARLGALEHRIDQDIAAARERGLERLELVLCGARQARTVVLPLQAPWWRWPRSAPRAPAPLLQRWLGEAPTANSAEEGRA
ncbi:putative Signal peptide protein [Burkholderiales bacterium]|nr:putative Signal peptide protein [Burkholderiales bacterium]